MVTRAVAFVALFVCTHCFCSRTTYVQVRCVCLRSGVLQWYVTTGLAEVLQRSQLFVKAQGPKGKTFPCVVAPV